VLDEPSAALASVILKQVNLDPGQIFRIDSLDWPAQAFLNECASLTFLTRLADEGQPPIAPRLYGADTTAGLLVTGRDNRRAGLLLDACGTMSALRTLPLPLQRSCHVRLIPRDGRGDSCRLWR